MRHHGAYTWRFHCALSYYEAGPKLLDPRYSIMTTNPVAAPQAPISPAPAPPPAAPSSPLRLVILLGLLGLMIAAYGYDFFVAKPAAKAANDKIEAYVDKQNKLGVKDAAAITPESIHDLLGMQPTSREVHADKDYEVEYYCWWGQVPLLSKKRHFISIVYLGKEPRRFSSNYINELPPAEALPISEEPGKEDGITLGQPESPSAAAADAPATLDEPAAKADEPAAADAPAPEAKSAPEGKDVDK